MRMGAGNQNTWEPLAHARTIVRRVYKHPQRPTLLFWQDTFLHWQDGAWSEIKRAQVRAIVYQLLDEHGLRPNRHQVSDVVDALQAEVWLPDGHLPPCWLGKDEGEIAGLVPCKNYIVDINNGRLITPTPNFFTLSTLPVEFDPDAPAPQEWLRFLKSIWPEDAQSILTLQELAGYLLTPLTIQHKIFLLVAPKRAGKGVIFRTLQAVLGPNNVAAPTLSSLGAQFGSQSLIGKLAAFISDARLGRRTDQATIAERLLSISGEDSVSVPRKFLEDFTARLGVRFVLSSNELPSIFDASGALASRFVVLLLTESFYGREDLELEQKLGAELPSILNWMVAGRRSLMTRGHFIQPKSTEQAIEQLQDLGSPISAFLRDKCEIGPGRSVPVETLYSEWRDWCESVGRRPTSAQVFGRDLRAVCPGLRISRPRANGGRTRVYEGVGLVHGGPRPLSLVGQGDADRVDAANTGDCGPARTTCPKCDGEGCRWCAVEGRWEVFP